jgi:hypothetical protein
MSFPSPPVSAHIDPEVAILGTSDNEALIIVHITVTNNNYVSCIVDVVITLREYGTSYVYDEKHRSKITLGTSCHVEADLRVTLGVHHMRVTIEHEGVVVGMREAYLSVLSDVINLETPYDFIVRIRAEEKQKNR